MLIIDAAAVVTCLAETGFEPLGKEQVVAPYLMWSEAASILHELKWRKEISEDLVVPRARAAAQVSPLTTDAKLKAAGSRVINIIGPAEL